jgi:hypothetical protein
MSRLLVLFESTHGAIKAERSCLTKGIPCKVIPVPRELTSSCGIALEVKEELRPAINDLLRAQAVPFTLHVLP